MAANLVIRHRQVARWRVFAAIAILGLGSITEPLIISSHAATPSSTSATDSPINTGVTLFKSKKYPEAKVAFDAILAADPKNAEALFYLGWTALETNDLPEAIKHLEKATAADATQSQYFRILGDAYGLSAQRASIFAKAGWAKKCLAAYNKAVTLDPDNIDARKGRLDYFQNAPGFMGGGMDKAYAEADEIRKRAPIYGLLLLCDLYLLDKKSNEIFARVEKLIVEQPEKKGYLYVLGTLAAVSGDHLDRGEVALKNYLKFTPEKREPSHAWTHFRLGLLYEKKGDKTAARIEYETALNLQPDFAPAKQSLQNLK